MVKGYISSLFVACIVVSAVFLPVPSAFCEDIRTESGAFDAARAAFDGGSYELSSNLLERFAQTYPGSSLVPQAKLLIGESLFHRHKYHQALDYFEVLQSEPGFGGLQDVLLYWIAEVHFRANNFARAAAYYRDILDRYPRSDYASAARYSLGWSLFEAGEYAAALKQFIALEQSAGSSAQFLQDTALKIVECLYYQKDYIAVKQRVARYSRMYAGDPPRVSYLFFYLGESEYYTENYVAASAAYEKAATLAPEPKMRALAQLGEVWARVKLKEYSRAQAVAEQINVSDLEKPNQDILLLARAVISAGMGKEQEAQDVYAHVIREAADPMVAAQGYVGRADALLEKGEYAAAVAGYELALDKAGEKPSSGGIKDSIRNGLAWARLKQGDYGTALEEFEKIARDSNDESVKVSALCQIGDAYQDAGESARAKEVYDRILREYPASSYVDYVRYRLGVLALRNADYDAAIKSFQELMRDFPQSPLVDEATYALGLAYFQHGAFEEAGESLRKFRTAFTDSPARPQALYLLGVSARNLKRYEEALEVFASIVSAYESDRDLCLKAQYQIAESHYRGGDEKRALEMFKRLRSKYPDASLTADIIWWLGDYYYRIKKPEIARRYFTAIIDDYPGSALAASAHYALGLSLEEESLHQEAIEHFQQVIYRGKSSIAAKAVAAIGEVYAKKRRHAEAAAFLTRNIDVVPMQERAQMHFTIAEQLEAGQKPAEAIDEYLKAAYLFKDNTEVAVKAYFRAAGIYESDNKIPEATVLYDRIIKLNTTEAKIAQERLDALTARASAPAVVH